MRAATADVDAVSSDPHLVRRLARQVAAERGWPEDWLNDGVKGFLSAAEQLKSQLERPGIRVQVPTLNYLIAMKSLAMRVDIATDPKHPSPQPPPARGGGAAAGAAP